MVIGDWCFDLVDLNSHIKIKWKSGVYQLPDLITGDLIWKHISGFQPHSRKKTILELTPRRYRTLEALVRSLRPVRIFFLSNGRAVTEPVLEKSRVNPVKATKQLTGSRQQCDNRKWQSRVGRGGGGVTMRHAAAAFCTGPENSLQLEHNRRCSVALVHFCKLQYIHCIMK